MQDTYWAIIFRFKNQNKPSRLFHTSDTYTSDYFQAFCGAKRAVIRLLVLIASMNWQSAISTRFWGNFAYFCPPHLFKSNSVLILKKICQKIPLHIDSQIPCVNDLKANTEMIFSVNSITEHYTFPANKLHMKCYIKKPANYARGK